MPIARIAFAGWLLAGAHAALALPGIPGDVAVDPEIPAPAAVLGFEPGERHPRHDQIVRYLTALAEASDRLRVEEIGRTHGGRPLLMLIFASPARQAELNDLRARRVAASRSGDGPPVVWLGYSVHGNEASGASAALVVAWYLAASRDERVLRWLDELVIVMEPAINPDGIDRFASWVNRHRGRHPSSDPEDREHDEVWRNGRTNYYWFDLNRDWLPLTHPESRARMAPYHRWRPHVVTDHHEMGRNSTFFFQPGIPERTNPLTPERNQTLTRALAEYHAEWLDRASEPFYAGESFDDFYIGKGSTYPDLTGGVGILFEQASSRGHVQDSDYGIRKFAEGVANQVRVSLSTLEGAQALSEELLDHQREFFESAREQARRDRRAGWLLGDDGDPKRAAALIDVLLRHDIRVHPLDQHVEINGQRFGPGSGWVIPAEQDHYRLLRSVFEPVTELPVDTFYDVSAWPLAAAWNLPLTTVRRLPDHGEALIEAPRIEVPVPAEAAPAWLIPWNQYRADAVLAALLDDGYRVQAISEPLDAETFAGRRQLVRGSLIVHPGIQDQGLPALGPRLAELSTRHDVAILAAAGGRQTHGIDLGSPSAPVVQPVRPALLVGDGISGYSAGYVWHWFDVRLEQPVTLLDLDRVGGADLSRYTHLILPEGRYESLREGQRAALADFVRAGGVIVALRNAADAVVGLELDWSLADSSEAADSGENAESVEAPERRPYADHSDDRARELIGGSALSVRLDITHPLAWGYEREMLVLFRRGRHVLEAIDNAYTQVGIYADEPLYSGYLSDDNRARLAGTPAITASRHGAGAVIRIADDPLFRRYWRGGEKLLANALFFGRLISPTAMPGTD